MRRAIILAFICLSLTINYGESKGLKMGKMGMKAPKSGGIKLSKNKIATGLATGVALGVGMGVGKKLGKGIGKGMGMGMGRRMGMGGMGRGLGMGMGGALLIPVVIMGGIGMGRHRHSYNRHGLQCYACEGMDNDMCVINPASVSRHVTCPQNQYCGVLRREITIQMPDSGQKHNNTSTNPTSASLPELPINNEAAILFENNTVSNVLAISQKPMLISSSKVWISRGCKSPEIIQNSVMESANGEDGSETITKLYSQFCLNDFCNHGDGRLKCYECEGQGYRHPCMTNPSQVGKIVTCEANHYCNIQRMTALDPEPGMIEVQINRGCQPAEMSENDYVDAEEGVSMLSLSCSSDLCNFVDGNHLALVSSATGIHYGWNCFLLFVVASLFAKTN